MLTAAGLWSLYRTTTDNLFVTDERDWTDGQTEALSWCNEAPTRPDPVLIAHLRSDIETLEDTIAALEAHWGKEQ